MRKRLVDTMPLIALVLFLFSWFVLDDLRLGWTFFLLIPLSWILLSKNVFRRLNQAMPLITLLLFLWLWLGFDMANPGFLVFLLIPLSDMLLTGKITPRKLVAVSITAIYVVVGAITGNWHPNWIIFFLIPIINNLFFPNKDKLIFMSKENITDRIKSFVSKSNDYVHFDEEDN